MDRWERKNVYSVLDEYVDIQNWTLKELCVSHICLLGSLEGKRCCSFLRPSSVKAIPVFIALTDFITAVGAVGSSLSLSFSSYSFLSLTLHDRFSVRE